MATCGSPRCARRLRRRRSTKATSFTAATDAPSPVRGAGAARSEERSEGSRKALRQCMLACHQMAILSRVLVLGSVAVQLHCGESNPPPSPASPPLPIAPMTPVAAAVSLGVVPFAIDDAGFPHLLRGGLGAPRMPAADAAASARMHVATLAPVWGVKDATLPALESL